MKKNKGNRLDFVAKLWGTRIPTPIIVPLFIQRYGTIPLFFLGYIVLFNLPIKFTSGDSCGFYLAAVLILWPVALSLLLLLIFGENTAYKKKKDWYYFTILKDESAVFQGVLKHQKHIHVLLRPFQYQLYYKKTEIEDLPDYHVFIVCTDSKNEQFIILSTKWKKLEIEFTDATEITSIPQEWFKMVFLKCNPFYLLQFLKQID